MDLHNTDRASLTAATCRDTAAATQDAIAWCSANPNTVRQERDGLTREFRKANSAARKLETAIGRPMCVGVFGPSQSGKSYLISALARHGTNPLMAAFDGVPGGIDFVRYINPEGGKESTGIVTRFTIRPAATPAGFPVSLRLLSQTDVVRILGNSYLSDCDLSEIEPPSPEKILTLVTRLKSACADRAVDGLSEDDMWELQEYFEREFRGEPIIKSLGVGGYWTALAEIGWRLPVAERTELFALLWGETGAFNMLFQQLHDALSQLDFASEAYCSLEALVHRTGDAIERRADSIIDVGTLNGLSTGAGGTLQITAGRGRAVTLSRASITALVAELKIVISDKPWDFFDHTDLLDFPGARSRENVDLQRFLKQENAIEYLFLRGKVACLFERYCAEQELTSMLLCIGPSNQEVRSLPAMVQQWINTTHGTTPAARAKNQTALFFVLTKFDAEFAQGVGAASSSAERWTTRLNASMLDFFGKAHEWPRQWSPGQAFNNTFWLRNPNFLAKHILDYDATGHETGLRASEAARIAQYRQEYLDNPLAQAHFADPVKAWDEAFRLNDGGITFLAQSLAPVCNPDIKRRQIEVRIELLRGALRDRLSPFYVSGDFAEQRQQREANAAKIVAALRNCAARQRFGRLLDLMQPGDTALADCFYQIEMRSAGDDPLVADRAALYADAALQYWTETLRSITESEQICRYFGLSSMIAGELVDELVAGARRLDLRAALIKSLRREITSHRRLAIALARPALVAANILNAYVMWLSMDGLAAEARPRRTGSRDPIFASPPETDAVVLSEEPSYPEQGFYEDWFVAFQQLVSDNVATREGQVIDIEQNERLGAVIRRLVA